MLFLFQVTGLAWSRDIAVMNKTNMKFAFEDLGEDFS